MEQKTIQEAIQVFCPICSKGILVRNESMYKCKKCGKEVCLVCFDRPARLCVECVSEAKKESTYSELKPAARESSGQPGIQSRKAGLIMLISGLTLIPATFLVGALVNLPYMSILVGVLEIVGFVLFIKGFLIIKD